MLLDEQRWFSPVPVAHRGSRFLWPENTLLAFQNVYDLGYRHFETDVHLTRDGHVVVIHDDTVNRTTEGSGAVADFTLEELQTLDAGYRHMANGAPDFRGLGLVVPTLEELLQTFSEVSIVIDLKADGLVEAFVETIDRVDASDRVIVGSFSDDRLSELRGLAGDRIATSAGPTTVRAWVLASRVGRAVSSEAKALQVPIRMRGVKIVDERLVMAAHQSGLQVHVWTVNSADEMTDLLDMGVDAIITDRPDTLKAVLAERGEWRDQ